MTYKTHMLAGAAIGIATVGLFNVDVVDSGLYLFGAILGSVLPDVDHPKSWIANRTGSLKYLFAGLGHRGMLHSLIGTFVVTVVLVLGFGINMFTMGLLWGYLSHLLMDSLNPSGVAWLWPKKDRYNFAKIGTNSEFEWGIAGILAIFLIWFVFK